MTETLHELKAKGGVRIRLQVSRPTNAVLGYESSSWEDQPNKPTTNMTMTSLATLTEPGDHGSWASCADHSASPSKMAHRISLFPPTLPTCWDGMVRLHLTSCPRS